MNMQSAAIFAFDRLSRERALRPDESDMLCKLIGEKRRLWTQADDRELVRMKRKHMSAPEIAIAMRRSDWAVRSRLHYLRRKEAGRVPAK